LSTFNETLNTAVFTSKFVIEQGSPILFVFHYDDGTWQFSGSEQDLADEDFRIVSLGEIIEHDESVSQLGNMPFGSEAIRLNPDSPWRIVVKN
jgi:hypothetical protein